MIEKPLIASSQFEMQSIMGDIAAFLIGFGITITTNVQNERVNLGDCWAQQSALEFEKDSDKIRIEMNWRDIEFEESEPEKPEIWAMIFINDNDLPNYAYEAPLTLQALFN